MRRENSFNIGLLSNVNIVKLPFTVNTYDIDIAGHVNNIVYVRWLEELRNKLFKSMFDYLKVFNGDYYPYVISTEIKYKKEIKISDNPIGIMELVELSHGILKLNASVELKNKTAATAVQRCVFMNLGESKILKQKEVLELFNNNNSDY
ncbi:MAG: thioesterase family protein [Melioribacteraceae bacterium]|nr:thioesterase family protein [Melioribacteraceae bacterium]